jgi:hypothetical protein
MLAFYSVTLLNSVNVYRRFFLLLVLRRLLKIVSVRNERGMEVAERPLKGSTRFIVQKGALQRGTPVRELELQGVVWRENPAGWEHSSE